MSNPFPVPSRYVTGELEKLPSDAYNGPAREAALRLVYQFVPRNVRVDNGLGYVEEERYPQRGLLLVGPTGTGKSTILGAMASTWDRIGVRLAWVSWGELCSVAVDFTRRDHLDLLRKVPALVVDDFAQVEPSVPVKGAVADLVECRYRNQLPLLGATNTVAEAELAKVLGVAVVSRLAQMCEQVTVKGPDRRNVRRG